MSPLFRLNVSDFQTFPITVNSVNYAPSFTAANPPPVNENAGAVTVPNRASFDPGAINESNQSPTYTVLSVADAALFAAAPTVDAAGNLRYTPADGAAGISGFTVQVSDDGGTAKGRGRHLGALDLHRPDSRQGILCRWFRGALDFYDLESQLAVAKSMPASGHSPP